jgi:serine/threonine protein kinase
MKGLALAAALLILPWSARGQTVNPDPTADSNTQANQPDQVQQFQNGLAKTLQTQQDTIKSVAGADQAVGGPTSLVIPTAKGGLSITIGTPTGAAQAPAPPPGPSYTPMAIASMFLLFGISLLMRRNQAPVPAAVPEQTRAVTDLGQTPFRIVRAIGEGGMGVVYEAIDTNLDRKVAVKRMRDNIKDGPADHERFIKEAKTVASLHHPNIVDIHAVVSQGGQTYLVFEFVEGKTVEELLDEHKRLGLAQTKAILDPVCRALEFAHERGIVHRDLKPGNVMITTLGQVKVMDFGIARRMETQASAPGAAAPVKEFQVTNTLMGTPLYQAPEAQYGVIRPEGDVYALGVMAYQMLCGDWPFPPPATVDMKTARQYARPSQKVAGLSKDVDALIDHALEPDAAARLRSPREFREKLAVLTAV